MNRGKLVENNFVQEVDNKSYHELSQNLQNFMEFLFEIKPGQKFFCKRIADNGKPDVKIIHGKVAKYISIKSGAQNSVHTEKLESFISFLKGIGVNDSICNYLLLYIYGDDTISGTGSIRYSAEEAKLRYAKEIYSFNKLVNFKDYLVPIIDRLLFVGTGFSKCTADAIYYGDTKCGVWCDKDELIHHFLNNKCYYIRTPHFSSLTCQSWGRNTNFYSKSESHRHSIQVKWFSILSDISKIRDKKDTTVHH